MSNKADSKNNHVVPTDLIDYTKILFDRYAADFDHIDNKSIGIMAIAGLLVGFQALSLDNFNYLIDSFAKKEYTCCLCCSALALLLHAFSVVFSLIFVLLSFKPRSFDYPTDVNELIDNYRKSEDKKKAIPELQINIIKSLDHSVQSLNNTISSKVNFLKWSIRGVFCSLIFLMLFVLLMIFHKYIVS